MFLCMTVYLPTLSTFVVEIIQETSLVEIKSFGLQNKVQNDYWSKN